MIERRKVDKLCVQETMWKGNKVRSIRGDFKLFYQGVDGRRNEFGVNEYAKSKLKGKSCVVNVKEEFWSWMKWWRRYPKRSEW